MKSDDIFNHFDFSNYNGDVEALKKKLRANKEFMRHFSFEFLFSEKERIESQEAGDRNIPSLN